MEPAKSTLTPCNLYAMSTQGVLLPVSHIIINAPLFETRGKRGGTDKPAPSPGDDIGNRGCGNDDPNSVRSSAHQECTTLDAIHHDAAREAEAVAPDSDASASYSTASDPPTAETETHFEGLTTPTCSLEFVDCLLEDVFEDADSLDEWEDRVLRMNSRDILHVLKHDLGN